MRRHRRRAHLTYCATGLAEWVLHDLDEPARVSLRPDAFRIASRPRNAKQEEACSSASVCGIRCSAQLVSVHCMGQYMQQLMLTFVLAHGSQLPTVQQLCWQYEEPYPCTSVAVQSSSALPTDSRRGRRQMFLQPRHCTCDWQLNPDHVICRMPHSAHPLPELHDLPRRRESHG